MRRIPLALILCLFLICPVKARPANDIDDVQAVVYAWRDAWRDKDIQRFISFYSPAFQTQSLDYMGLLKKKARLFQRPGVIVVELDNLDIQIDHPHAAARFIQRYQDSAISDVGEKTLILVKSNLTWKIISEEWKPVKNPVPASKKGTTPSGFSGATVKDIQFQIEKNGTEKVYVSLSHFIIPEIITLGGDNPRIAIDFKNIFAWEGDPTIPANGRLVRQIRAHLHADVRKLRIVLDLNPNSVVFANPTFYKAENIYCLEVKDDAINSQP